MGDCWRTAACSVQTVWGQRVSLQSTLNKKVYSKECVSKNEQVNMGVLVVKVADVVVKDFPSHVLYRFR